MIPILAMFSMLVMTSNCYRLDKEMEQEEPSYGVD